MNSWKTLLHQGTETQVDLLLVDAGIADLTNPSELMAWQKAGGANVLLLQGNYERWSDEQWQEAGLESFLKKPFLKTVLGF